MGESQFRRGAYTVVLFICTYFVPLPLPSVNWTGDIQEGRPRKRDKLLREGEGGWCGAESYDRKKAWTSINHSILSDTRSLLHVGVPRMFNYSTLSTLLSIYANLTLEDQVYTLGLACPPYIFLTPLPDQVPPNHPFLCMLCSPTL